MANYDLSALMTRLVEMEKESIASVATNGVDAVSYFPYEQDDFPYWTNRIRGMAPDYLAQDTAHYPFQIAARLVIGHLTEGYKGEVLTKAYEYIPAVTSYFKDKPGMNSIASPTQMDDIFTDFEFTDVVGPVAFQNSGIGVLQVGVEFIFTLPIIDIQYR